MIPSYSAWIGLCSVHWLVLLLIIFRHFSVATCTGVKPFHLPTIFAPQIVVGHGGTDLVENYIIDRSLDGFNLEVGRNSQISVTVEEGEPDSSAYGYAVLKSGEKEKGLIL